MPLQELLMNIHIIMMKRNDVVLVDYVGAHLDGTVFDGGSAKDGGIVPGDRIIEADGIDLTGARAENASYYITGEEGTFVTLKIRRANGEMKEFYLQRRKVVVPSLASSILDENIGYIIISSFTENTHIELEEELKKLKEKNIEKLIIDLRNNGGGVMDAGIQAASLLMEKGKTVISTKGKEGEEPVYYTTDKDGFKFKTVLLTNEYTASSSEIMSCALIDNGYAVSVGKTTYGKACAQALYPLSIGGALRVTTLNYYTPNGISINKTGIPATYSVDNETYYIEEEDEEETVMIVTTMRHDALCNIVSKESPIGSALFGKKSNFLF